MRAHALQELQWHLSQSGCPDDALTASDLLNILIAEDLPMSAAVGWLYLHAAGRQISVEAFAQHCRTLRRV